MKTLWLITFRSVTFAQRAQSRLQGAGIASSIQRTPTGLSDRGCSYSLRLRQWDIHESLEALQGVPYSQVFLQTEGGWEQWQP